MAESGGTERRGTVLGIALVVTMAAGVLALGLSGAFPERPSRGAAAPTVTIAGPLPAGPTTGRAYRLTPPPLDRAGARRIFAAVGVTPRVRHADGIYFASRGLGTIVRTPLGWFVDARTTPLTSRPSSNVPPAGPAPSKATTLAAAYRALDTIGAAHDGAHFDREVAEGPRTVRVDRRVGGGPTPALGWSVTVDAAGAVVAMSGYLTGVVPAGRVPVESSTTVAEQIATARSTITIDRLGLWAVTVGTNMMGYTPVFGSSVKYVLLGAGECRPIVFHDRRAARHPCSS